MKSAKSFYVVNSTLVWNNSMRASCHLQGTPGPYLRARCWWARYEFVESNEFILISRTGFLRIPNHGSFLNVDHDNQTQTEWKCSRCNLSAMWRFSSNLYVWFTGSDLHKSDSTMIWGWSITFKWQNPRKTTLAFLTESTRPCSTRPFVFTDTRNPNLAYVKYQCGHNTSGTTSLSQSPHWRPREKFH